MSLWGRFGFAACGFGNGRGRGRNLWLVKGLVVLVLVVVFEVVVPIVRITGALPRGGSGDEEEED